MNMIHILKNSVLGCAMVLEIFSNDVNAGQKHEVTSNAFKHFVTITQSNNYIYDYYCPKKIEIDRENEYFLTYGDDQCGYWNNNKDKYFADLSTYHHISTGCNLNNCEICKDFTILDNDIENKYKKLAEIRKQKNLEEDLKTYFKTIVKQVFGSNFDYFITIIIV